MKVTQKTANTILAVMQHNFGNHYDRYYDFIEENFSSYLTDFVESFGSDEDLCHLNVYYWFEKHHILGSLTAHLNQNYNVIFETESNN